MAQFNAERRAEENLISQGFDCYFPKLKEIIVVCGRKVEREALLFGRYFFVSMLDTWRSISGTRGVTGMLMMGDRPSVVTDEKIDEIRGRETNGFIVMEPPQKLRRGQHVRVESGPFYGLTGVYAGMSRGDREIALLNFVSGKIRVEFAVGSLVAA